MSNDRESRTIEAMVGIYCAAHHTQHAGQAELCDECRELLDYALVRLGRCPFQPQKPTCAKCLIHCYRPDRREQIREVMKFAGPRMIWQHPTLALQHVVQGLRSAPPRQTK